MFERKGRPKKLDIESEEAIYRFMSEESEWDRYSIYELVKLETENTARRRYHVTEPPAEALTISRSCLWRLTNTFLQVSSASTQEDPEPGPCVIN